MSEKEKYKWFIAHVAYRNDNNVKSLLDIAGLECYMPFKTVVRTWKGEKKEFQVPAIPSCTFVRVAQSDFIMLQMMKEISLMADRSDHPLSLSDEQMEIVRQKLDASDNPGAVVLELIEELINR
ncbi:hypothetical protein D0T87_15445 [Bacteroides sp. 51]|nr:hypothetical protein [Bacteroides sp. 51]